MVVFAAIRRSVLVTRYLPIAFEYLAHIADINSC
jgi:hypothetical protein